MQSGMPRHQVGLIDHDAKLRHQLLGAFQILCGGMVAVASAIAFVTPGPLDRRSLIPPIVLALGTLVQHLLWRRHLDKIVSFVTVGSLFLAMITGTLLNGIEAPSAVIPLLSVLIAGYLLGRGYAWKTGMALILVLLGGIIATRLGYLPTIVAPEGVWSRIIAIQIVVSAGILAIPLRGLLSGVQRIDQEKAALEESVHSLERHRRHLTEEIARRTRDLELANSDLSVFSSVLSHDLKVPLRSIQGLAETLKSTSALTSPQTELLERILERSAQLDRDLQKAISNTRASRPS